MKKIIVAAALCAAVFLSAGRTSGAENSSPQWQTDDATELAKKTQNPVADLISVPFQYNVGFETGPEGKTVSVLNIQPVIPFHLNTDWNLITRTIVPIVNAPQLETGRDRACGVGDTQFSAFLSPGKSSKLIWGFGPIFELPTNTGPDNRFGSDNWSAGPTFVILRMEGPWVYGVLWNQLWSFTNSDPEVNKMLIQPFINYNMKDGWYLTGAPIITADWTADSGNQWTIPVGGGIGKIIRIGKLPVNISTQAFYNVQSPARAPTGPCVSRYSCCSQRNDFYVSD